MTDSLAADSRELSAISREFDRTTRSLADIDPAQLDPARLVNYHRAQSVLRKLRSRIEEARRRLAETRRRRVSRQPFVLRRDRRRFAARVRRSNRRKAAARTKKAAADPPPPPKRKRPPGGKPAGTSKNTHTNSSGVRNKPSGAAAQAPIHRGVQR